MVKFCNYYNNLNCYNFKYDFLIIDIVLNNVFFKLIEIIEKYIIFIIMKN